MTKRKVRIFITSRRWGSPQLPFDWDDEELCEEDEEACDEDEELSEVANNVASAAASDEECADGEPMELMTEGHLLTGTQRVELVYDEGALSGMEGSVTTIGFDRQTPQLLTMMRSGAVRTAMVFEQKQRHMSVYETPFGTFSICVTARKVVNRLFEDGTIELHYTTAVNGRQTELCRMQIKVVAAD